MFTDAALPMTVPLEVFTPCPTVKARVLRASFRCRLAAEAFSKAAKKATRARGAAESFILTRIDLGDPADVERLLAFASYRCAVRPLYPCLPAFASSLIDHRSIAPGCSIPSSCRKRANLASEIRRDLRRLRRCGGWPLTCQSGLASGMVDRFGMSFVRSNIPDKLDEVVEDYGRE